MARVILKMSAVLRMAAAYWLLVFAIAGSLATPSEAHRSRKSTDGTSGISIANLSHGQLEVMNEYRSEVAALAARQSRPSLELRTLHNFMNLQFSYCLWGLFPNSISNEESPFNECSHAYLAASKALLDRLLLTEEGRERASALAQKVEFAMLRNETASVICANGIEPFNTSQIIMPEWRGLSLNPLGLILGAFIFAASAGTLAMSRARRRDAAGSA